MATKIPEKPQQDPPLTEAARPSIAPSEARDAFEVPDGHDIFFAAIQTTRMPMIVTDPRRPDNPIVFANNAFVQMTGYERHEVVGRNCRFLQGPGTDRGTVDELRAAIEARREIAVEVINHRKDGTAFWNALFVSPVHDTEGNLVYFFGSQLDVSRRRDAEDGLRQAQKMEALGQLTGGIAHDFNNLLQVTLGYVDLLRGAIEDEAGGNRRLTRAVDRIEEASRRGATLTQQLLAFARKQRLEGRSVNLNHLVETLTGMAGRTLGESVTLRARLDPGLWTGKLDPVQAEMALLNILINARDAMPRGGTVTVQTFNREVGAEDRATQDDLRPGRYAVLSVTDTGTGMPPEVLARVMEPFFTTKDEGKGTGLGLSMVYGFMKQSGGAARIYSEVGHGTTVNLFFPAADGPPAGAALAPEGSAHAGNGRDREAAAAPAATVLAVEDRREVLEVARAMLEDAGYGVLGATSGAEALRVLEGGAKVDLLFSDLIMPGGMNGVTLAREARRRQPRLKVLLTTGYAEASLERQDVGGSGFEVINKPYRRADLLRKVRQVMDGPTGSGVG